ncbi:MAG TPA: type IV secretion protein Rhs [Cyanobacteria bacterium UBA11369]|nr:type IV secretion protein Rhs [Cyanobacteria bacterium UBA11371]HBE18358.1 type IV secretion protein Rhs [Cyanobacteria bacterium UBA11367]HBE29793.1 type IV secretion protein Rhs [Cyanobacteria bacterium UBA11368]HBE48407.1 type IV secretion protein Rhs [Cyanobacteria bacterium UBA11369]
MNVNYRALAKLEIDGQQASPELMNDIIQIIVEESLHLAGMFTLVIKNDYFPGQIPMKDRPWRYQDLLKIGASVKIGFISSTTESQDFEDNNQGFVIEGEITAIEAFYNEQSQAPVIIRGYDVSHRLYRGRHSRSFQNMTDSDIVKKIADEVGIPIGTLDPSGVVHDYVFQQNQTYMEFLRQRAARIGFEFFVQDGKLNFRNPKADSHKLTLKWLKDIHSFRVRLSSSEQVKEVEVRAWDYSQKRPIVSTKNQDKIITQNRNGKGSDTSNKFKGQPPKPKMIVVDQPLFNPKEADIMAQALCDELGGQFIYADAKAEGNAQIRPGRVLQFEDNIGESDMGPYTGEYYITETRHTFIKRIYMTEFSVRGLRGGDILTTLSPTNYLLPGQTLLVGIVTDNEDPEGWGRVKVKFPTLTEEHTSNWARVVTIGAGDQRGFDCLPEINDEVLVAFEHGDIHRPYIIGAVWNGKDAPPNQVRESVQDGKVRMRTFKSRAGHHIQFVEENKGASKKGIYIETAGGHKLHINDSDNVVEIATAGGHNLSLNDQTASINITTLGLLSITAGSITLTTTVGPITATTPLTGTKPL